MAAVSGARGRSRRKRGVVLTLTLAVCALAAPAAARASSAVYWSNALGGALSFANLDGSGGGRVEMHGVSPVTPEGVTIDPVTRRIYWADRAANEIEWADLAAGTSGALNTRGATVAEPMGIVIGSFGRSIYWANHGADSISWARLNGSGGGDLQIPRADVEKPVGVTDNLPYSTYGPRELLWTSGGEHAGIYAADIAEEPGDPVSPVTRVQTGSATVAGPSGIAAAGGRVYWANSEEGASHGFTISFASLDPEGREAGDLQTGGAPIDSPLGVALDPGADRIYWVNTGSPGIAFASLDGTGASGALVLGGAPLDGPAFLVLSESPQLAAPFELPGRSLPERPELRWQGGENQPWVGSPLICDATDLTWREDLPGEFLLRAPTSPELAWTRDGTPVGVPSPGELGRLRAAQPGTYTCTLTASNVAGVVSLVSNAVTAVPAPPLLLEHLAETYPRFAVEARSTDVIGYASRRRASPGQRRHAVPFGTTFSFTLSRRALVAIQIERVIDGRRTRGRCIPNARGSHRRARCTLYKSVLTLYRGSAEGGNKVSFSGRTPRVALRPGSYRAVFSASDEFGSSRKEAIAFVVLST